MRTTVTLDEDVHKAREALRRETGLGLSAALNDLVRRGLADRSAPPGEPFRQRTSTMGTPRVPLDDIGSTLELLRTDLGRISVRLLGDANPTPDAGWYVLDQRVVTPGMVVPVVGYVVAAAQGRAGLYAAFAVVAMTTHCRCAPDDLAPRRANLNPPTG